MPVPLRSNKAEAKYNVTTDFPHLGLHSAAATGNIGLVKYALSHGQPINSVLDGVLPLHAACSGGNDLVVKLLIQNGADVNAPRLPRRYFNDKNRDASAPIVGTSGSTPLHFAAANGHTEVITTLLHHGAHANRADKHGVTPEMLARQNGALECAEILKEWLLNKDRDLRERHISHGDDLGASTPGVRRVASTDVSEGYSRKRVQVKRSIDNTWKSTTTSPRPVAPLSPTSRCQSNPSSPAPMPSGQYSFYPVDSISNPDLSDRRPSLPQLNLDPPTQAASSSFRRPRSAGMDAEHSPAQRNPSRKLVSKYSLLHLFKKGQTSPDTSPSPGSYLSTESPYCNILSAASASALPIPIPRSSSPSPLPNNIPLPSSSSPNESCPLAKFRSRLGSDTSSRCLDMQHAQTRQTRDRSASGASRNGGLFDDDVNVERPTSPLIPPGILRSHNRSSSSGQSQAQLGAKSSFRALRFESSSSSISKAYAGSRFHRDSNSGMSPSISLRGSNSATSLKRKEESLQTSPGASIVKHIPGFAPATTVDFDDSHAEVVDPEEDEEEYGKEITWFHDVTQESNSRLTALRTENRSRGQSFTSSSSSLSPIILPEAAAISNDAEFPFSINQPPPLDMEGQRLAVPLGDNRARGDSVSSASTDGSNNPQLSSSGTTGSSITTPGLSPLYTTLRDHQPSLSPSKPPGLNLSNASPDPAMEGFITSSETLQVGLSERRSRNPLDINIRSISSHAQAEALVQRAQKSILEMADLLPASDEPQKSAGLDGGWTPLSAKLAAYGESLAIERRLKREEEGKRLIMEKAAEDQLRETPITPPPTEADLRECVLSVPLGGSGVGKSRRTGLERQFSLEHSYDSRPRAKVRVPKRPNTSGGTSSDSLVSPEAQASSIPVFGHSESTSVVDSSPGACPEHNAVQHLTSSNHTRTNLDDANVKYRYHTTHATEINGMDSTPSLSIDPMSLSRVSTAPTPVMPSRDPRDNARHIASASKLTRMGFATPDVSVGRPAGGKRFGLKSFMQSLTGKS